MNTIQNQEDYFHLPLSKAELSPSPFAQFSTWFSQAKTKGELEPTAMTLATVDKNYIVSARMVLLKSFDENGFTFFTNYLSLKAKQLEQVPHASVVFWWPKCQRQVRISGAVALASDKESDTYFKQRTKESQIAAIVSKQSAVIANRQALIEKYEQMMKQDGELKRPDFWGGYVLKPNQFEFWQGREHRLHDRFLYSLNQDTWEIVQLSP